MRKRDFLTWCGAVLLGSAARPSAGFPRPASAPARRRIVVVGAGLAGLAAASALTRKGHDVVVVEARDRIGGRVWTSRAWPDTPLDLGATWIHGIKGNPISDLADDLRARRLGTSYDRAVTFSTSGRVLNDAEEARLDDLRAQVSKVLRRAQDRDPDRSVRQALEPLAQQFAASPEAMRFISFIVNGELEHEYGGSADQLSVHWYDDDEAFGGEDVLFAQGFGVIADHLAGGVRVERGQVVQEIHWGRPEVRVVTQAAEFAADRVIVTLPLGVLKSRRVLFSPGLPSDRLAAIDALGMGVLNKCYLRFPHVFWPQDADWVEHVPARHGEWTEWVSFARAASWPVLLGFNAADRGREIEAWPDARIVASAMQTLRALFGAGIPEPLDHQVTRWASDPFAGGSYSFNAVGSTPEMRTLLATPVGERLFFAGEATSRGYFGTAHGAYLSGQRAARDVLAT